MPGFHSHHPVPNQRLNQSANLIYRKLRTEAIQLYWLEITTALNFTILTSFSHESSPCYGQAKKRWHKATMPVLCHIILLQDFQPYLFCKGSVREGFTSMQQISSTKIRIKAYLQNNFNGNYTVYHGKYCYNPSL